jgi:ubiquinone/menaquinone biosynthesis C-methylase UbiE
VDDQLEQHYEHLAETYDATWDHRPDYVDWMQDHIRNHLQLKSGQRIVDIGAGTGLFLKRLLPYGTPETPVVAVEPSAPMLDRLPEDPRLTGVLATAEEIVAGNAKVPYDEVDVMMGKEAVHHFKDIDATVAGLCRMLASGGRILFVSLPPKLQYPLFQAALDRFASKQPDPEAVAEAMRGAGLEASVTYEEWQVKVERDEWVRLVGNQWMSVLSSFSDEEIARGQEEIRARYTEPELQFVDRFAFISGRKP